MTHCSNVVLLLKRVRAGVVYGLALMLIAAQVFGADGKIGTDQIEIDGKNTPATQEANLYPFADPQVPGTIKSDVKNKPPANIDWVQDSNNNTDENSFIDGIATGIDPAGTLFPNGKRIPTGAVNGKGHWHGLRIVDGAGDADQEIVSFGKFDAPHTWQIEAKNIGGAKYDLTQAYIAASGDVVDGNGAIVGPASIFAGVERGFNNGTFYMGIEFNLLPPIHVGTGCRPNRFNGDILFLITLQGSAGSGTVNLEIQEYQNGAYAKKNTTAATTSINSAATPAGPWGRVDSHGNWVLTDVPAWQFAEICVPLSELSETLKCAGSAYVQLHSRSAISITSDVKDVTQCFKFEFRPPTAVAPELGTDCDAQLTFQGGSNETGATNEWEFKVTPATVILSGGMNGITSCGGGCFKTTVPLTGDTLTVDFSGAPGVNSASIEANLTVKVSDGLCAPPATGPQSIIVYRPLDCNATLTGSCNNVFTYSSTISGGSGGTTYAWIFEYSTDGTTFSSAGGSASDASAASGTYTALATQQGLYRAKLTVTDSVGCPHICTSNSIDVRNALTASASKNMPAAPGAGLNADSDFSLSVAGSTNALSGDSLAMKWQSSTDGTTWIDIAPPETGLTLSITLAQLQTLGTASNAAFSIGTDPYVGKVWSLRVRLHAERTLNGTVCPADSAAVFVKGVKAVDP